MEGIITKETKHFSYYSRGSLYESKTWLSKACKRGLITQVDFDKLQKELDTIGIKLNKYINSIGDKKKPI